MHWPALFLAGIFEIIWAVGLKYTEGWTRLWPSVMTLIAMGIGIWLLAYAAKHIPIGTAYAVWTGIGAFGVALIGMIFLGEPVSLVRIACLALILSGIIGLKLSATV